MKRKVLYFAFLLLAGAMTFSSCEKDKVKSYPLNLKFTTASEVTAADVTDLVVVITGETSADTLKLESIYDTSANLPQGNYNISVNGKIKGDATAQVQGTGTVSLFEEKTVTVNLSLFYSSPLLFKTIHCTGGAQYYVLDSYVEIVNNSDEVQYLDGLMIVACLANLKSESVWQTAFPDKYQCGQGSVLAFPGSGKDYPIQPGEFVIVADQALNHKLAYGTDESKKEEYAKSPDLSKANFEKYFGNGDVDNENVPNMEVVFSNNKSMKMCFFGVSGKAFYLVKLPAGMTPSKFAADEANFSTTPGSSSTTLFMLVPNKYVLDAVDVYANGVALSEHYPFFIAKDDASGIEGSAMYSGKCVRRKVAAIEGGRVDYKDTNNSSADWKNNQDNTAGFVPTSVD
jgi:hypothetical protein